MASTTWYIQGIDTRGADLALSRIVPWGANGALTQASITCSFAPKQGVVADLLVDNTEVCAFSAKDVGEPGFLLTLTFTQPVDLWGFRFAGPSEKNWFVNHVVREGALVAANKEVVFRGPNVLSAAPTNPLKLGVDTTEWGVQIAAGVRPWYACAVSFDARVQLGATATAGGMLWLSRDGGGTWSEQTQIAPRNWRDCAVSANGQVLVGVPNDPSGHLWLSTDGGVTWGAQTQAGARSWHRCAVSDDGRVLLAAVSGGAGTMWLSTDGGITWLAQTSVLSRNWYGSAVSADGRALLATAVGGLLWLSTDGGVTWRDQTQAGTRNWYEGAVSADGQVLFAAPLGGFLWLSTDGGVTWREQTQAGSRRWLCCSASADGRVLLAGYENGFLWLSTDGGVTWREQTQAGVGNWQSCRLAASGREALVAQSGGATNLRSRVLPDPIYTDPPIQTLDSQPKKFVDSEPLPQGLGPVVATAPTQLLDAEFGGKGRIYGKVERKNTPTNVPMVRRVRLHRSRDGLLVRETWSKADGSYEFREINENYEYDTIAWDNEMNYRSVVANNLKPEV